MNLLEDPWIPVRAHEGAGEFRLLTYRQLLCEAGDWQVSLPRDDLELACLQLLVCMTQVMFLPDDIQTLRARLRTPLSEDEFAAGIAPCRDWFDLDHPNQPFMQSRGVRGEWTSVQKLLPGLPEKTSKSPTAHCFFNEVSEVENSGGTLAAISLFNQASNCPSFGGGFKGSLRGGAPITTLVFGDNLREIVWRNVLTRANLAARKIAMPGPQTDKPTWVEPIAEKSTIHWNDIGLARGLFWQPARVELVKSTQAAPCDVLGGAPSPGYSGFRKEKFNYTIEGVWPHPHGTLNLNVKKGELEQRFASFTTTAPAWTQLSEFVIPHGLQDSNAKEGSTPAGAITQSSELDINNLILLIGGYHASKASVLERRHELVSLAEGWRYKNRLKELVDIGLAANRALCGRLLLAANGYENKKRKIKLKGLGVNLHKTAEKLFYTRSESLIHQTFSSKKTFSEWRIARGEFADELTRHCRNIFSDLTEPFTGKPESIPIVAWVERSLNTELKKLKEEAA